MAKSTYTSTPLTYTNLASHPDTMQITLTWKNQQIFSMIAPTEPKKGQIETATHCLSEMICKLNKSKEQ